MIKMAYETTACNNHDISDIEQKLHAASISNQLTTTGSVIAENYRIRTISKDIGLDIRPFAHPIVIGTKGEETVVFDSRAISRRDAVSGKIQHNKDVLFNELRCMFMLTGWLNEEGSILLNNGDVLMLSFSKLLSQNLGVRMNLDPISVKYLEVLSAYYYYCLHSTHLNMNDMDKFTITNRISRVTKIDARVVADYINDLPFFDNLEKFIRTLATSGKSERLTKLTVSLVYTLLGGIWFGPNANEVSSVSLEHPPTYNAMLYMIAIDKSYRKTILSSILSKVDRNGSSTKVFTDNVMRHIKYGG